MSNRLFREYRFKFYLNASHSIIINGKQGEVHPHTWEIILDLLVPRDEFRQFHEYEKKLEEFLFQFQDKVINDVPPFDTIVPTLENIVDYMGRKTREIVENMEGHLLRIEGSETPTRSYVISYNQGDDFIVNMQKESKKALGTMIDDMLDRMLD